MARTNAKTSTPSEKETTKVPTAQATKPANTPVAQTAAQPSKPAATPVAQATPAPARHPVLTHEQIARRAYEIYLERSGGPGSPDDDWAQAVRELSLGR